MHQRHGTITPAVAAFAGLLGSAQTLAQNAYIPGQSDNTVSVISTATNTVTTVIHDPSFNYPFPVAVAQDGSKVYVANYGLNIPDYSVTVISTATNTVTAVINDSSLNMPDGNARIEPGHRAAKRRRGVPLYHQEVRPVVEQYPLQTRNYVRGRLKQGLTRAHAVQIVIRANPKHSEDLVQQLSVLSGHADLN